MSLVSTKQMESLSLRLNLLYNGIAGHHLPTSDYWTVQDRQKAFEYNFVDAEVSKGLASGLSLVCAANYFTAPPY